MLPAIYNQLITICIATLYVYIHMDKTYMQPPEQKFFFQTGQLAEPKHTQCFAFSTVLVVF